MIVKINGAVLNPVMEAIEKFADKLIEAEVNIIMTPVRAIFNAIYTQLAANSAELITLGIIVCAVGAMVAPLYGSSAGKWMGRGFLVLMAGVIWRVVLL